MYGVRMRIEYDGFGVNLRPFAKTDLPTLVAHFDSMKIHMYTMGLFAQTLENEEEWYENNRKDKDSCVWAIQPDGFDVAVGTTALHDMTIFGSCASGIIIWDTNWWGKGVASRAHLGRTLFAADYLNRLTIKSSVRTDNVASFKALTRVGYNVIGLEPRTGYRGGKHLDTHLLTWLHPERMQQLYPKGTPENYKEGIEKASLALLRAREVVSFP